MKKIICLLAGMIFPLFVNAQDNRYPEYAKEIFNVCASIFTLGLVMIFILAIMKRTMDHKLKDKILEKGVPDEIVSSVLKTNPKEDRNLNIKWFAILMGLGTGLAIINYTLPIGIHSLAIMAFSIAASFLGYFFFLKQSEK